MRRYHQHDSFSLKKWCFIALAFLPIDDNVDGHERLVGDDGISQPFVYAFENIYLGPLRRG